MKFPTEDCDGEAIHVDRLEIAAPPGEVGRYSVDCSGYYW